MPKLAEEDCEMNRRSLLKSVAAGAGLARAPRIRAALPKKKITRVRIYTPPDPNPLFNQSNMVVTVDRRRGYRYRRGRQPGPARTVRGQADRPGSALHRATDSSNRPCEARRRLLRRSRSSCWKRASEIPERSASSAAVAASSVFPAFSNNQISPGMHR
jgi:hypothetical protein